MALGSKRQSANRWSKGRADCEKCGRRDVSIAKDGRMRMHRRPDWTPADPWCDPDGRGQAIERTESDDA